MVIVVFEQKERNMSENWETFDNNIFDNHRQIHDLQTKMIYEMGVMHFHYMASLKSEDQDEYGLHESYSHDRDAYWVFAQSCDSGSIEEVTEAIINLRCDTDPRERIYDIVSNTSPKIYEKLRRHWNQ